MESVKKKLLKSNTEDIKKIVDDSKKNYSAYVIQDWFRNYRLRQQMINTAQKLKEMVN
jgi:hypothetical protein